MANVSEQQGPVADAPERPVPDWLANLAAVGWRALAVVAFVIALGYLVSIISTVLASIGLAVIVAVILAPLVLRLRDGGRTRTSAAGLVWIVALAAGIGVLGIRGIDLAEVAVAF